LARALGNGYALAWTSHNGRWRTYVNARFGAIAAVSRNWPTGREPGNGGLAFSSPDSG